MPATSARPVQATELRNYILRDPLLDWLAAFPEIHGYLPDHQQAGYDPDTDFSQFIRRQGIAFEKGVIRLLQDKGFEIARIARAQGDLENDQRRSETVEAIRRGVPVIYQAVLWDEERGVYGKPDLLVRMDYLNALTTTPTLKPHEIDANYVVVDIKFTGFDLSAKGLVGGDISDTSKKSHLLVYNRALGQIQGHEPPFAYLLGRTCSAKDEKSSSCLDMLGPCDMTDPALHHLVDNATEWIRWLHEEGAGWRVLPEPSVTELRPHMTNTKDSPWHHAKRDIGAKLEDLTLLWQVGPKQRGHALDHGISKWTDPKLKADMLKVGPNRTPVLQAILDAQTSLTTLNPASVSAEREAWITQKPLEFYVDFETVNDLDDDFAKLPYKNAEPLIFMVGCGHVEGGEFKFKCFIADQMDSASEANVLDEWIAHMAATKARLWPGGEPLVFHWSPAELSFLEGAYNAAEKRHNRSWGPVNWFDFLKLVVKAEPVTVKGSMAFGLKAVAKSMFKLGLIQTEWTDGPGDGLAAMVGAWTCGRKARVEGCRMIDLPLMQEIEKYNRVDTQVMWEIISYLRANH